MTPDTTPPDRAQQAREAAQKQAEAARKATKGVELLETVENPIPMTPPKAQGRDRIKKKAENA